jgi:hypothetical protein
MANWIKVNIQKHHKSHQLQHSNGLEQFFHAERDQEVE